MKLAGDASSFPNPKQQLHYTSGLLVGQAFTQVIVYIMGEGIKLADVPALIMVLEMAFRDPDLVVTAE
jgi:hypothetical protein